MIHKQMKELIEKRKLVEPQDGEGTDYYWKLELEVLEVSLETTIEYINTASEDEIYWCSEVWEDLSTFWKSKQLIEAMENCQKRYPNIAKKIQVDIDFAKKALNYDKWYN